jgi:hypothetical protein
MGSSFTSDFTTGDGALGGWATTSGKVTTGGQGGEFTLAKRGDAPTIDTSGYFLFGKVEVVMKAAPGTGIVSSIVLESDALDEIDWVRPALIYHCVMNLLSNLIASNRKLWAATRLRSRQTTSARAILRPMTVPLL